LKRAREEEGYTRRKKTEKEKEMGKERREKDRRACDTRRQ